MKPALPPLVFALVLTLIASCHQVPVTGRRTLNLVDDQELAKISMALFDEKKARIRISKDRALNERLQRVGERLSKMVFWDVPNADWEFVVFDAKDMNAFAMAGGKVGVYRGLMETITSDDQLAFVIAHEIAHVGAKHVHEKLSRQMTIEGVGTLGMLGMGAGGVNPVAADILNDVYGITTTIGALAFSRAMEKEADYIGLMYMARAGYDPQESIKVLEVLEQASAERPAIPSFLSTHPTHPERMVHLLDVMAKAQAERENSPYKNK